MSQCDFKVYVLPNHLCCIINGEKSGAGQIIRIIEIPCFNDIDAFYDLITVQRFLHEAVTATFTALHAI